MTAFARRLYNAAWQVQRLGAWAGIGIARAPCQADFKPGRRIEMASIDSAVLRWIPIGVLWLGCVLLEVTGNAQGREQTVDGTVFRLPEGLRIEKVAGSPLVERPIVAAWDDQGRLLVLEAAGPVARQAEAAGARPHRLVRLVDGDGDGTFDRRIVAAEDLSFPVGVLARGRNILVSAPPEIWLLRDDDGDGVCEHREIWFNPGTATHCYNDLHGPYLGRDGWIYWTKGAFASQNFTQRDGEPLVSSAAHIYRRKLEGGPIESVMTGGMDNPVEVAFSPAGERFFSSTFLQHPAGGRRDGLAHAIYGGLYGKDHEVLNGHWRTGELLPIMTHLGPAAPSGLAWVESPALFADGRLNLDSGSVQRECLIAAQFNLQKVSLHRLIPEGATFRTEDVDLLSTERIDFHPTDVLQDRDGSWLVFDTGGWYDLCCPSSAVDQSGAVGGIYRLSNERTRNSAAPREDVPQLLSWGEAWAAAEEQFAWVRQRAEDWIVEHPEQCSGDLVAVVGNSDLPAEARLRALWLLCRIGSAPARQAIVATLKSELGELRQAAALAISVHRWAEEEALIDALKIEPSAAGQRSLAEALGRVGGRNAVPALMECIASAGSPGDRALEHSLLYALIELNQSPLVAAFQNSAQQAQWLAATRMLHERDDPRLSSERLLAVISNPGSPGELVDFASEILAAHPEFLSQDAGLARQWYRAASLRETDTPAFRKVAQSWSDEPALQRLIEQELANDQFGVASGSRAFLLSLIVSTRVSQLPESWQAGLAYWLTEGQLAKTERVSLLSWLRETTWGGDESDRLKAAVLRVAATEADLLATALSALPAGSRVKPDLIEGLVRLVESGVEGNSVAEAWRALGRLDLPEDLAMRLAESAPRWKLDFFSTGVEVLAGTGLDRPNRRLLELLPELPLARTIPLENYRNSYSGLSLPSRELAERLVQQLAQVQAREDAQRWEKIDQLIERIPESGDPNRGMQVFRATQAACSSCHQVAYVGGAIGPDLSRIGSTRSRRELLEAIAFPSARQEQSYRSEKFALVDGRVVSGLVEEAAGEWLTIRTGPEQRVKVRRAEIEERVPSDVSLMPAGIMDALSPEQLADLLAFLESRK